MRPVLAAALAELGELPPEDRPMLAAHWLAEGMDGETLRALAWLSGTEREVHDLWPQALADVGVRVPPDQPRRIAMAWAAGHVVRGDWDVRWQVQLLAPWDSPGDDEDLDSLIYAIDDDLDWTDHDLRSKHPEERRRAEAARRAVDACIAAMARDDIAGAERGLAEWER